MKILLVEDDLPLLESIERILGEEFQVAAAQSGDEGLYLAEQNIYDLIILDIMLPVMSGLDVLRQIRQQGLDVPVLLLTAKDSVEDKVRGLDQGADDYLVKPFAVPELLARVRALLRRKGALGIEGTLRYGPITLHPREQTGYIHEKLLSLTAKEYALLEYLVQNAGNILTREQLFDRVWGFDSDTTISVVELYIHYLRKKLTPFHLQKMIRTVRGIGYMLKEE
ncbi:response regulator transcription factor [Paenactinomyces guangxiensis]|uniref:Response regulator transcription factor n=1 Tax=Paenactinomyces guangxiensis TaxID=1490290 RepID=A0A7W1WQ67_9BACL|nr:response regulator transcription factor [Paenactinomyces guangxiensis]MBA4493873.1 response regulator transcription factor [Paenactinomyces guangxiensis]MBH8591339.1 response regulator transcription factor [Paenactinomyces guangxiensis]